MESACRCEARRNKGEHCQLCMGRTCRNTTYRYKGCTFHLVEATFLWRIGVWDGPLSGIAIYKGIPCYAKTYTIYRHRTFWLYPLKHEEWLQEIKWKADWTSRIGNYTNYTSRKPLGFFRLTKDNRVGDHELPTEKNNPIFLTWDEQHG